MYIAEVLPFTKSINKEFLSYFCSRNIPSGTLVDIEIRKRTVPALVLNCYDAKNKKDELKTKEFSLKKIQKIYRKTPLRPELCVAAKKAADHFGTYPGNILSSLIPKKILDDISMLPTATIPEKKTSKDSSEKYIIQDSRQERESQYRNIIRQSFVHHKSVLILCPTIADVERLTENLSRGIKEQVYKFHSKLTHKKAIETWKASLKNPKPIVIVTTPIYTSIPRHDLGACIIEKESAQAFTTIKRPVVDITYVIEMLAHEMGLKLYRGDTLLRLKTLYEFNNDRYHEYTPARFRFLTSADSKLIEMNGAVTTAPETTEFELLHEETKKVIKEAHEDSEHVFIYTARAGLASSIVCSDCGTIVTCSWCSNPMVLIGKTATEDTNHFHCRSCGEERPGGELCKHCDSWKLKTLGVTSERVRDEIANIIPKEHVFLLDSDHTSTAPKAKSIVKQFFGTPGSVLVGTEMALLYLNKEIDHVAVATIDPLFSIPNFDMREKIMRTLLQLRNMSRNTFIVQTRKKDEDLFTHALRGNSAEFVRKELADREKYNYPPFSLVIKITAQGNKYELEKMFNELVDFFKPHDFLPFTAFTSEVKGKHIMNGIIRLDPSTWIDDELLQKIKTLPPYLKVIVDAQSLL